MHTYELSYKFLFDYAYFAGVKAKGSATFKAKDDARARKRAKAIISKKNRKKENNEYDFVLVRLVRVIV